MGCVGLTPCTGIQAGLKGQHIPEVWGNKQVTPTVPWGHPFSGALGGCSSGPGNRPRKVPSQPGHLGSDTQGGVSWGGVYMSEKEESDRRSERYW